MTRPWSPEAMMTITTLAPGCVAMQKGFAPRAMTVATGSVARQHGFGPGAMAAAAAALTRGPVAKMPDFVQDLRMAVVMCFRMASVYNQAAECIGKRISIAGPMPDATAVR